MGCVISKCTRNRRGYTAIPTTNESIAIPTTNEAIAGQDNDNREKGMLIVSNCRKYGMFSYENNNNLC